MTTPLRVLILEDKSADAQLMLFELRQAGYAPEWTLVETEENFLAGLQPSPDVVLSDFSLPSFDAIRALRLMRGRGVNVPFIIVSGSIGEDVAVEAMKEGAADYLLKDRMGRLGQAVENALKQHQLRLEYCRAADELKLRDRAIQAVAQGILIMDPAQTDNPIIYASPGFEKLTGYQASEVIGRNWRFLAGSDTDIEAIAKVTQAISSATPCLVELQCYRKVGIPLWIELSISPVRDDMGKLTHFVASQVDVTARRKMEDQFRQMQKMEAIGRVAGGIAHDFNNLLTIINGYGELLLNELAPGDPLAEYAEQIQIAGERAASLTQQLLAFSRRQMLQPVALNLNTMILNIHKILQRLIGENIEIGFQLHPELWMIVADRGQMEQVLLNLCLNSRDAMPDGGELTIETTNVDFGPAEASANSEVRRGRHVMLAVRDTGTGMDKETVAQVFEPFFTTKEVDKGTGLGLATVYGIVKQSGGQIDVDSEPGSGTAFRVYLPCADSLELSSPSTMPQSTGVCQGSETLLLVEDEDGVRTLAAKFLGVRGYRVLEARNGDEALQIYGRYPGEIQLVVTDVVMPVMGGRQLIEQLRQRSPSLKVAYMSAYTADEIVRQGILTAESEFIQKPFTEFSLTSKVREILDKD